MTTFDIGSRVADLATAKKKAARSLVLAFMRKADGGATLSDGEVGELQSALAVLGKTPADFDALLENLQHGRDHKNREAGVTAAETAKREARRRFDQFQEKIDPLLNEREALRQSLQTATDRLQALQTQQSAAPSGWDLAAAERSWLPKLA